MNFIRYIIILSHLFFGLSLYADSPSPLYSAILNNDQAKVAELIRNKIDVNKPIQDKYGQKVLPILHATGRRYTSYEILKLLVEAGADVNAKDDYGSSPLSYLLPSPSVTDPDTKPIGALPCIKLLVESGAKINEANGNETVLFRVCSLTNNEERKEIFKYLLENGADINIQDEDGGTCLSRSMMILNRYESSITDHNLPYDHIFHTFAANDRDFITFLIENGADPDIMDKSGRKVNMDTFSIDDYAGPSTLLNAYVYIQYFKYYVVGMILLIAVIMIGRKYFIKIKRQNAKVAFLKVNRRIRGLKEKIENIDCQYFPNENLELAELKSKMGKVISDIEALNGKEEEYNDKKADENIKQLEKEYEIFSKKIESLHAELKKVKVSVDKAKVDIESMNKTSTKISDEIRLYDGFEGLEIYQTKIREFILGSAKIIDSIKNLSSFDELKRFFDQENEGIYTLIRDFTDFAYTWEMYVKELKQYQSPMERSKSLSEQAERKADECRIMNEEEVAARLLQDFSKIANESRLIELQMSTRSDRKDARYYEENLNEIEQQFREIQNEFNEKFKAVVEFKRLPDDKAKKEWILKNGYISWFFDDPKIAEKFREFDSMEEKFRYLIKASEKLRFLDIQPREEKTTWIVFMQSIYSSMSYEDMKSLMKEWQTDTKFKSYKESWAKKLNESDPEEKKLLTITTKFLGMRF